MNTRVAALAAIAVLVTAALPAPVFAYGDPVLDSDMPSVMLTEAHYDPALPGTHYEVDVSVAPATAYFDRQRTGDAATATVIATGEEGWTSTADTSLTGAAHFAIDVPCTATATNGGGSLVVTADSTVQTPYFDGGPLPPQIITNLDLMSECPSEEWGDIALASSTYHAGSDTVDLTFVVAQGSHAFSGTPTVALGYQQLLAPRAYVDVPGEVAYEDPMSITLSCADLDANPLFVFANVLEDGSPIGYTWQVNITRVNCVDSPAGGGSAMDPAIAASSATVTAAISLIGVPAAISFGSGTASDVLAVAPVTLHVWTNSASGYDLTIATTDLAGDTGGTIPRARVGWSLASADATIPAACWAATSDACAGGALVEVASSGTRSAASPGDAITVTPYLGIPSEQLAGSYTGTAIFTASTLGQGGSVAASVAYTLP